jgi:hypothetical protein
MNQVLLDAQIRWIHPTSVPGLSPKLYQLALRHHSRIMSGIYSTLHCSSVSFITKGFGSLLLTDYALLMQIAL